ncbi:MAG: histidine kinase N-terminal 7TM domain-containing protein [bacterium]|nr:histidine kinase N-terminal 7TM domain-containing protein [bacterium]
MLIFTPQNSLLLIAGLVNLVMSIWVFTRGLKNKINLYFGLLTFFNFLWAIGLIFSNTAINYELNRFSSSVIYPISLMIVISLFYFAVYFPYETFKVSGFYKWLINVLIIFYSIYCIFGYKLFVPSVILFPKVIIHYEPWSYTIFSIIMIVLMLTAIYILYKKYISAEGIFRTQLLLILIATIIGTSAGVYFNLFFMYTYDLTYNHFGPLCTLFINFVVFSFIVMSKDKIKN